ncbi:MAG TPA: universal stress protein [Polyangia bacterium]|jgi:nucleotide-binding universal stress UspA family protein|nr:universal stress protein [Polyangia bacterium]
MDPKSVKRILVPLDFSASSDEALSTAIAFARAFSARLELVHVIVEPIYPLPAPLEVVTLPVDIERIYAEVEKQITFALGRVREAGVSGDKVILNGRPHVEIVSHAEKIAADLIVIGSHGRSGFSHALLGSVAERVVHRARCPVLVVPAPHSERDQREQPAAAAARER